MNVIITGGTEGLGRALVITFLKEGHNVFTCSRKYSEGFMRSVMGSRRDKSQQISWTRCDVRKAGEVRQFVDHVAEYSGTIDVLINNAAVFGPESLLEKVSPADWKRAIEINLFGPMLMSREVIPHFRKKGGGRIVNVGGGGVLPLSRRSAYSVSKVALYRLTEVLAHELGDTKIQVNALSPGYMPTRFHGMAASPDAPDFNDACKLCLRLAKGVPYTGRIIAAKWDPYRNKVFKNRMKTDSSFCTLRRVDK